MRGTTLIHDRGEQSTPESARWRFVGTVYDGRGHLKFCTSGPTRGAVAEQLERFMSMHRTEGEEGQNGGE
jgi:hypothetical protein